jgi:two-component sensor histidine kinase/DNA-binding response OmpR family regulator
MRGDDKVNILLVDDQPAKLLSYEVILREIDVNLIKASSGREALEHLLKSEIAVVLMDVCMPELDGFELAAMIRDHPRFRRTAIIFISAIHLTDVDRLRAYEMGAVDYVPVPVIPEVLRAKVRVFAELYRKSRQLEQLNAELERRVADRTAELERSTRGLQESEDRRNLALAAGKMGSWDWDLVRGDCAWDEGQKGIFGVDSGSFEVTFASVRSLIDPDDWKILRRAFRQARRDAGSYQVEFRILRPDGDVRWCLGTAAASKGSTNKISRISGVTIDITDRKEAEERQSLLAREVDHRAKNALAVVHAIVSLTRADNIRQFVAAVEGRIQALARAHSLLSESRWRGANIAELIREELAPYRAPNFDRVRMAGSSLSLEPSAAQALALALHELATNAAKYGALSLPSGRVQVEWELRGAMLELRWTEAGGPPVEQAATGGFGIRVIKASVESQLGGAVEFDWRCEGLRCAICIPHQVRPEFPGNSQAAAQKPGAQGPVEVGPRKRVLLVEDESLIAMMMEQTLRELDFDVVGPFGTVKDALAAIERAAVDAGILDINLSGEMAYPIARILQARKVPFVFMTGYGAETIAAAPFPEVRIFQKPLERETLREFFVTNAPDFAAAKMPAFAQQSGHAGSGG